MGLLKELGDSHLSISHLGVFSKSAISSSDRVNVVQQIRGKAALEESIGKNHLMGGKRVNHSTQGTRADALSCIAVWEKGRGGRWAGVADRESGDQGCCAFASLTELQPISARWSLRSFVIQKIILWQKPLIKAQSGLARFWRSKCSQITAPSPRYYKQRPPPTKTRVSTFSVFPPNTTTNDFSPTTAITFRL